MHILTIVGARPQFVKAAVLSREIRRRGWRETLVHTGQHYDEQMSGVFFEELGIPSPDLNLAIGSGGHGEQTGRMLAAIERVLLETKPDWVVVFGDTNSTLAGALAAAKLQLPVAHVEAGLRSFNRTMPEEINRVLVDHLAELLLAPTKSAVDNLRHEGIDAAKISLAGDVMCDATRYYRDRASQQSKVLDRESLASKSFILATIHRAENTDHRSRLQAIVSGLVRVAKLWPVVWPMHPRTAAALKRFELWPAASENLRIIEPVGYLDMTMLETHARRVVTDSGGVQKEAYFCHTPCVTLRDETEWVELVEAGWNQLLSPAAEEFSSRLAAAVRESPPAEAGNQLYGDGNACQQICDRLQQRTRKQCAA
jgi:UDP-GlcNAc3NAcA epimerase